MQIDSRFANGPGRVCAWLRATFVAVMKTPDLRNGDDAAVAVRDDRAMNRRVLVEREMCAGVLVVLDVGISEIPAVN
jgi:hypothetical protein